MNRMSRSFSETALLRMRRQACVRQGSIPAGHKAYADLSAHSLVLRYDNTSWWEDGSLPSGSDPRLSGGILESPEGGRTAAIETRKPESSICTGTGVRYQCRRWRPLAIILFFREERKEARRTCNPYCAQI